MLEILLGIAVCVIVAKVAEADDESAVIWFCITFALCVAALTVPLPILRMLLAGLASFLIMTGRKLVAKG